MPRIAPVVPPESSLLCEGCGYVLDGLPADSRCPECGRPIVQSPGNDVRLPPAWERRENGLALLRFLRTSALVLFRPTHFYKTVTTRAPAGSAKQFGRAHWLAASALLGTAAYLHYVWYVRLDVRVPRNG